MTIRINGQDIVVDGIEKVIYNKAIDDFEAECHKQIRKNYKKYGYDLANLDLVEIVGIAEQLKGGVENDR